jgi:hypothetical protein
MTNNTAVIPTIHHVSFFTYTLTDRAAFAHLVRTASQPYAVALALTIKDDHHLNLI